MIAKALVNLRPGAQWRQTGFEYSGLEWLDTEQSKPMEAEVVAEVARLEAEYAAQEYQRKRALEYPPVVDYLDGVVKGDQAQIAAYIAACQAVKNKYPKPE
jgi:tRNA A37 N6-isopentenylltransferase MiaA